MSEKCFVVTELGTINYSNETRTKYLLLPRIKVYTFHGNTIVYASFQVSVLQFPAYFLVTLAGELSNFIR